MDKMLDQWFSNYQNLMIYVRYNNIFFSSY